MAPVRGDESGPDLGAPVLVMVTDLGHGDVEPPLQLGEQRPDHGAFLLEAVHVPQEDVEFNPSDPHGVNASDRAQMVSSPIRSQPSPSSWRLMMRGVSASACGMSAMAFLKCSLLTWSPAASSLKASTRTNSLGSSTLRDQSNHRLPGSSRVASVKSATRPSHLSDQSGLTLNLTTMKITGGCLPLGNLGVPDGTAHPFLQPVSWPGRARIPRMLRGRTAAERRFPPVRPTARTAGTQPGPR